MTHEQACKFRMPFGKYSGTSLELIVTTDSDGPRYLDWMVGLKDLSPDVEQALKTFLALPWVVKLVEEAIKKSHTSVGKTEPIENLKKVRYWWE